MTHNYHNKNCGSACCLRLNQVSVQLGGNTIVKDVSLHVHCGEMVALIGPNGAGKSTILKAILGQLPYEGVISFSVPGIRHRKPPRIGYVPQSPAFDAGDPFSVADLFSCCMGKRPAFLGQSCTMRNKVLACLARVDACHLIDKKVGALSGGELQRVLLALALEPLPNILILDEPLSGVDVTGHHELMDMLDELRKTYDLSILITTHDFGILPKYADQVVLIDSTVLAHGKPEAVLGGKEFAQVFHQKGESI